MNKERAQGEVGFPPFKLLFFVLQATISTEPQKGLGWKEPPRPSHPTALGHLPREAAESPSVGIFQRIWTQCCAHALREAGPTGVPSSLTQSGICWLWPGYGSAEGMVIFCPLGMCCTRLVGGLGGFFWGGVKS